MAAPGDAAVVRHQDGVRPGDDIAGARCHAGYPVQDRRGAPQRAGLGPPGGAAVPGGQDGARRSHRLAPQRAEAGHCVQPLPRAAGLRPPRTGRHRGAARAWRTRPGLARAPTTSQQDRSDTQPGRRCCGRGPPPAAAHHASQQRRSHPGRDRHGRRSAHHLIVPSGHTAGNAATQALAGTPAAWIETVGKDVAKSACWQSGRDRLFRSPAV
jgi:hypothetical protein